MRQLNIRESKQFISIIVNKTTPGGERINDEIKYTKVK